MKMIIRLSLAIAALSFLYSVRAADPTPAKSFEWGPGIKVMVVGGNASHDFEKWFHQADKKILEKDGLASLQYTEEPNDLDGLLDKIDVLILSNNKPMTNAAVRARIMKIPEMGPGLIIIHAGGWYSWRDWPEYNKVLVGGGTRGHDNLGAPFVVTLEKPEHPILAGVPATFELVDELYNFKADVEGSKITVLATSKSPKTGNVFPCIWVTDAPKGRIVNITLGHDGRAHDLPAFQTLLRNTVKWVSQK